MSSKQTHLQQIGERLQAIRLLKEPQLTQKQFSEKYGITPLSKLSKVELGNQMITVADLMIYIEHFEVNAHWLLTGQGNRFINIEDYNMEELKKTMVEFDQRLKQIEAKI